MDPRELKQGAAGHTAVYAGVGAEADSVWKLTL